MVENAMAARGSAPTTLSGTAKQAFGVGEHQEMPLKVIALSLVALAGSACAAPPIAPPGGIAMTGESTEISGWFSAGGEWAVYPNRISRRYDPYATNGNLKCVSVVNGTRRPRSEFRRFNGKHVVVRGYATDYDKLPNGDSPVEKLMSKKVFGRDVVENFCLRQYVFVATELHEQ
ncbi:MAG: hypothetical protein ABIW83_01700 [Allosphingosinicella sp.]